MATQEMTRALRRPIHLKTYARSVIAVLLLTAWPIVAASGLLLWLAPEGQRAGQATLLFDLTKHQWTDVHFWLSISAVSVTLVHVLIDWRALRGCLRYLVSAHQRGKSIREECA